MSRTNWSSNYWSQFKICRVLKLNIFIILLLDCFLYFFVFVYFWQTIKVAYIYPHLYSSIVFFKLTLNIVCWYKDIFSGFTVFKLWCCIWVYIQSLWYIFRKVNFRYIEFNVYQMHLRRILWPIWGNDSLFYITHFTV